MKKGVWLQLTLLDNLIWVLFAFFFIIMSIFVPNFFGFNNITNIFYHSAILGVLVLAQGLVLLTGQLDLSVESTLCFAPGISILVTNALFPGINPAFQIILALLIGVAIGWTNGFLITKLKMNSLLESLSMLTILRGLVLFLVPFAITGLLPGFTVFGNGRWLFNLPVAIFVMLGLYLIFAFIMGATRFGRFLVASGGNPRASFIAGVKVNKIIITAFMLSGLLAAVAGILAAGRQGSISNAMGTGLAIQSLTGAILGGIALSGGRGTVFGMLGGTLLLGLIDNSLTLAGVNVYLLNVAKGSLILIALVLDSAKTIARSSLLYKEKLRIFEKSTSESKS
jgi:ribose/xylose/arabinose/galactoside ABC-type transport system permease subunit